MSTQPVSPDADVMVLLEREHRAQLRAFLERDVPLNLFALSWLENYGITPSRSGVYHFRGLFGARGQLDAMALVISDRLILLDARRPLLARYMGCWYNDSSYNFQHIVSASEHVEPFWEGYTQASYRGVTAPASARLISPQRMYVIPRGSWNSRLVSIHGAASPTGLREASITDLDAVFLASAMMHREETFEDPLRTNPDAFRNHVRHRIESGRSFVWFDEHRRLLFKADISAQSRYGVQISGVYTTPLARNKGIATRAMIDLCRIMFARGWPRTTLYVNSDNMAARRVYEKVGFRYYDDYQTIFVNPR